MATISKFYLLDAATPNTGTMPTGDFLHASSHSVGASDATGYATARDATDVHGSSNPDLEATATAANNQTAQTLWLRRFVSRPLAARTFAAADGNWTWDFAWAESNTSHNGKPDCFIYVWRPSTGLRIGGGTAGISIDPAVTLTTSEAHYSGTSVWATTFSISDGDILVFEISDFLFTQSMSSAYTTSFSYNGTTDSSTTTCASYVTPPSALTLFTGGTTYTKSGYAVEAA